MFFFVRFVKKKLVIKGYIVSKKYSVNKEKFVKVKKREMDIVEVLDKFDKEYYLRGEMLFMGIKVY